ncbi:sigma-54 interaction domain-containing protein [Psychrobacillus lasiicapitis]|uniref:PAS domain-containing protein n=1 Tax=Psychrobacillus lasiicapitis TaxID=1636719 RepID=A0A544T982_9BACI|nr:sigma 54-interacting transcriptional regulator [Psychrobacillus lasiicapitis]TQR14017.1 PAS domain-containing protein [Psychrobacillus lasiicapitis]GGA37472.1 sigma-54-dependent Fis family transcriptional regulator [Psychrobacillus lasiicapitis]
METFLKNLSISVLAEILENAFQWFVVVDEFSNILYINEEYCRFLEVERKEAIGKPVAEVIENTKMHEVIKSGIAHIASPHYIKGTYMLANRVPLVVEGKIVGAFGSVIFRDMSDWKKLSSHVRTTMERIQLNMEDNSYKDYYLGDIKGTSAAVRKIKETIEIIAPSDIPVLIEGESGTGKEIFAHSIHQLSERSNEPFVKVNCAAVPPELLEEELFGKYDLATGKFSRGRYKQADKGTLFIDEISALPLTLQAKLLRALQDGTVFTAHAEKEEQVDVRILASSNVSLANLVEEKKFREDLFYRIQAVTLQIPPLRERLEDLDELLNYFLQKFVVQAGRRKIVLATKTREILQSYHWPGNVRELQNVLQAAVYLAENDIIEPSALPIQVKKRNALSFNTNGKLEDILIEVERRVIQDLLESQSNKATIAKQLGISRSTLYEKIKKYNL